MWISCALLLVASLLQASPPAGPVAPQKKVDLIVIEKSQHTMILMSNGNALKTYHVALSTVPVGAKERVGDHKVPEGKYTIDEKKPQSRTSALDSTSRQLPITKQVHLVLANMAGTKALRRAVEVLRKILHRVDVATDSAWGVVATLEFIQHQLPKMGHGEPPCDPHPIPARRPLGGLRRSARRASDLVQTPKATAILIR